MQNVAREMNLSETAFLRPRSDGFDLRWFTPAMEVDLCGHATLASAHVLYERGVLGADEEARFHTASGLLTAVRRGEWLELDFPAEPAEAAAAPAGLLEALGARPVFVGRNRLDYLVEVESEEAVRSSAAGPGPAARPCASAGSWSPAARRSARRTISSRVSSPPAPASTRTR